MKRHSYGKLMGMSWDWMVEMLFRPFSLKKWVMLAIIIMLAGQMGGANFNVNMRGNRGDLQKFIDAIQQQRSRQGGSPALPQHSITPAGPEGLAESEDITPQPEITFEKPEFLKGRKNVAIAAIISGLILLFIGIFMLLWLWVFSNFSFVFLDSVLRNDASLRVPFHRNKPRGNSYFKWNIILSLLSLLVFGGLAGLVIMDLARAGVFSGGAPLDIAKTLSILLKYVPVLLITGILFFLVAFFAREFVLPIMYKRKIGILKAWGVFLGLLKKNIGEMLLFLLVRLGLSIAALIAAVILSIIGVLVILLVGGILFLIGWLIYNLTPVAAKPVIMAILGIVGLPLFVLLMLLFSLIFIPIPVFFRIFSVYVLGSIDESLDLFAPKSPEELAQEADTGKYKKSMRLVWLAVLMPPIFVVMVILVAIALPGFLGARKHVLRSRQFGIEQAPFEVPQVSDMPVKKISTPKNPVTVYLRNGNTFEADLVGEAQNNAAFSIEGGSFVLPKSDILRIERNP